MTNENRLYPIFKALNNKLLAEDFVIDKSGSKTVEILGFKIELDPTQPILDFGVRKTPIKYCEEEIKWYESQSLSVDIIGNIAGLWKKIADKHGNINSNYGWCIFSKENYYQFSNALEELKRNKESRRSCMIYNRPSMQYDYCRDGMQEFMCTFATSHFIRDDKLIYIVNQRSMDLIYGFFSDLFWHCHVYNKLFCELVKYYPNLKPDSLIYIANTAHIYEKHFQLLHNMVEWYENKKTTV
jgi:thymidylate synthase